MTKPTKTPQRKAPDDAALAWGLAATAHPRLSRIDADRVYIALGIGETFAAIDGLLTAIARNHIPLSADLVATTTTWLDCYLGQDAEPRLRQLLDAVKTDPSQQLSAPTEPAESGPDPAQQYRRSG